MMIDLIQISKVYTVGRETFCALKEVELHIADGDFLAIQGTSGSGKTTLLNIIGCLDSYSSGKYILDGVDVASLSDEKKAALRNEKIGFVLQDFALINDQTVLFNTMLPLLLGKIPYTQIKGKALQALSAVGMIEQAKKKVNQLSGGQRQRVAIARAIVNKPEIILADEPTGQLDSETGKQIMDLLKSLNDGGVTVIVVTHDSTVAAYGNKIVKVVDGVLCTVRNETKEKSGY